jgi:hypothetical protein
MSQTNLFCKNCKHLVLERTVETCGNAIDAVTGDANYVYCGHSRSKQGVVWADGFVFDACGYEAKYFEPREVECASV